MGKYTAVISWERNGATFTDNRYSRGHAWKFDGGIEVRASASPHVVPLPHSIAEAVDPEEAFVASLSSCHMLWFLSIALKRGFVVERYRDEASGLLAKNDKGILMMTRVALRPEVVFAGRRPSAEEHEAMHHEAHELCFLASSVKTEIEVSPTAS